MADNPLSSMNMPMPFPMAPGGKSKSSGNPFGSKPRPSSSKKKTPKKTPRRKK